MGRFSLVGRRLCLAVVLMSGATLAPAGAVVAGEASADSSSAGHAPAGPRLQADFNGDGAQDLVVGAPEESVGALGQAGAVNVLYGVPGSGLRGSGSQLFTQNNVGVGRVAEESAFFGSELAVGDFDADGFDDLAIGAPDATVGTVRAAGTVTVLYGSGGGLTPSRSRLLTHDSIGTGRAAGEFEGFGGALAAGDLDFNGRDDLAIGVPGATVGRAEFAGLVDVVYGSATGLLGGRATQIVSQDTPGVGSSPEPGDAFGLSLAIGDFNGSGEPDLAVGVPDETVGSVQFAGAVNVIYGTPTGLSGAESQLFHQGVAGIASDPERSDLFGGSLAVGDFDGDRGDISDDLAVGVPGESVGPVGTAGAVHVIYGSGSNLNALRPSQLFTQNTTGLGSTAENEDRFGSALAAGNFDGNATHTDDLAIGVPNETVGTVIFAGAVNVVYGVNGGNLNAGRHSQLFTQNTRGVGSDPEVFDNFGAALAVSDFDADGPVDLAIGVPGESVGSIGAAGAINVVYGTTGGLTGVGSQVFHQGVPGIGSDPEGGDFWGETLAARVPIP